MLRQHIAPQRSQEPPCRWVGSPAEKRQKNFQKKLFCRAFFPSAGRKFIKIAPLQRREKSNPLRPGHSRTTLTRPMNCGFKSYHQTLPTPTNSLDLLKMCLTNTWSCFLLTTEGTVFGCPLSAGCRILRARSRYQLTVISKQFDLSGCCGRFIWFG